MPTNLKLERQPFWSKMHHPSNKATKPLSHPFVLHVADIIRALVRATTHRRHRRLSTCAAPPSTRRNSLW